MVTVMVASLEWNMFGQKHKRRFHSLCNPVGFKDLLLIVFVFDAIQSEVLPTLHR